MIKWLKELDWETIAIVIIGTGLWSGLIIGVLTDGL